MRGVYLCCRRFLGGPLRGVDMYLQLTRVIELKSIKGRGVIICLAVQALHSANASACHQPLRSDLRRGVHELKSPIISEN